MRRFGVDMRCATLHDVHMTFDEQMMYIISVVVIVICATGAYAYVK